MTCGRCGAEHKLSGPRVGREITRFACKRCGHEMEVQPGAGDIEVRGGKLAASVDATFPLEFGRFRDIRRIAYGGMGDIYLARQVGAEGFESEVVLKVLHRHLARDPNFAKAMVDEAKLTVLLNHPNIVRMHNLEREGELLFCVMEYVPGQTLLRIQRSFWRRGERVPFEVAVYVATECLAGLGYAHELKDHDGNSLRIVHRDVSPQNILIGGDGWVKIIDFGIAKASTRISDTRPGTVRGKFAYMAPEQLEGRVDHRADLFSVGVVLWETCTGHRLFLGGEKMDTVHKLLHLDPPPIRRYNDALPAGLESVLERALQKDPDRRYQSAGAFRAALLETVAPRSTEQLREAAVAAIGKIATPGEDPQEAAADERTPIVDAGDFGIPAAGTSRRRFGGLLFGLVLVVATGLGLAGWWMWGGRSVTSSGAYTAPDAGPVERDAGRTEPDAGQLAAGRDQSTADVRQPAAGADRAVASTKPARPRRRPVRLDRKTINRIMRKHRSAFQRCADRHLSEVRKSGRVGLVLDFTIAASGRVVRAEVQPKRLEATRFGRCFLSRVRSIRFPRHVDKTISIEFPLELEVVRHP